jgi:hypothetical protein
MGRWDFWCVWSCPLSGVEGCVLCADESTARAIAEQKLCQGFIRVQVITRRAHLHKRQTHDVPHRSLPGNERGGSIH